MSHTNTAASRDWRTIFEKFGVWYSVAWTLTILFLTSFTLTLHHKDTLAEAKLKAQDYYTLNLGYRAWNARAGGVYVPADKIAPNPHLTVPNRDITTTDGRRLTLVNPAYMTRMVFAGISEKQGQPILSKLVSLKPLNQNNLADTWEQQALLSFKQAKQTDISQVIDLEGNPYLRFIAPFITDATCLKCHAGQGCRVGDVLGGISISIPLSPYFESEARTRNYILGGYLLLWLSGTAGITIGSRRRFATEAARRKSDEKYRMLFRSMPDGVFYQQANGDMIDVNQAALDMFGLTRNQFIGRTSYHPDWQVIAEDGAPLPPEQHPSMVALRTGKPVTRYPIGIYSPARGDFTWLRIQAIPQFRQGENTPYQAFVMLNDVTEQYRAESALLASEAKYRNLLESMQEGFALHEIICSEDGRPVDYRFLEVNPAFCRLTGLNGEKVIGRTVREIMPETEEHWITEYGEVALNGGTHHFEDYSGVLDRHFDINVFSPAPRQFAVIFTDVTERRRLQDEALKAQKLESLGLLAGGIAHDFNNILTAVIGNISVARMLLNHDDRIAANLKDCEQAAMRAAGLTRQLLTFAKGGDPVIKAVDTEHLLHEAVSFSLHGTNCIAHFDLAQDIWNLNADTGQLHQVLNNLVINAVQAMPDGGAITIRAENCVIDDPNQLSLSPGRYVKLGVTDQGTGIPHEHIGKIFDPYFTTKSSGTGLGLASVYSIIKRHGGTIQVSSTEQKGTTFTLYLPSSISPPSAMKKLSDIQAPIPHAPILLMDDEESIRKMATSMLEVLGYRAVVCPYGTTALELYLEALSQEKPFAAVILDMTIPGGKSGKDIAESIRAVHPDAVMIISSGYSVEPLSSPELKGLFRGSIAKPYNAQRLGAELKRVLSP